MGSLSSSFVRGKFSEYYQKYSSSIQPPASLEEREFGFLLLKERIMLRHKSFGNVDALRSFLEATVPSDVYYSSAYYESPEREMDQKGWLGADLIFDIDADHIPTPCRKIHDTWVCSTCGEAGRGASPEECPSCKEQKFDEKTWLCEVCLESAKAEAMKLIDFLTKDFGFSEEELKVAFSGHRGYHVHVESEEIRLLNSMARKEIVDYVLGIGLETGFHGLEEIGKRGESPVLIGPDLSDLGWKGRIARGTYDFLLAATSEELRKIGLKKKVVDLLDQHKETLLESWKEKTPWGSIKDIGIESWKKIADYGVKMQSAKIDTVVTTDTHRLIRLTNTLHGKTGLRKMEVPTTDIERFDPLKNAVTFKEGTLTVVVSDAPKFRLGDNSYGPFKGERVELPTAAALFLLCKGAAEVR
jgi:DNA primase small subunit